MVSDRPGFGAKRDLRPFRGQAMVEYSIITHAILLGGGGLVFLIFNGNDGLLAALNRFYDSVFFVLSTAAL